MSMVAKNNIAAQLALGELNKNISKAGDLLAKVSSGQKINSAKDDSAMYAISEKMREQIRSLLQDNQNVQNGSNLFKIADGAINNIVEELRNLKELAINSANDTNTDSDRATIQKEFTQKMANINDIATTTNYNGKTLLDGTYRVHDEAVTKLHWVEDPPVELNLTDSFTALSGTEKTNVTESKLGNPVTSSYNNTSGRIEVEADFSKLKEVLSEALLYTDIATALDGTGFIIECSTCNQFISFVFDGTTDESSYNKNYSDTNSLAREFTIGIKGLTSIDDLPKALYEGIKSLQSEINGGDAIKSKLLIDSRHTQSIEKISGDSDKYVISRTGGNSESQLLFNGRGATNSDSTLNNNKNYTNGHW